MEKFITSILAALMLTVNSVWADPIVGDSLIQISIHVNTGAGTITVNDESVFHDTLPYTAGNGTTMIPMTVITDAFGAETAEADGVVTVTYMGVEMVYTVGSSNAVINGQTITMPAAVECSAAGEICVPLRFFAEALGADITYDTETREIAVIGTSGALTGEVDFRMLLRYGDVTKVGSSKEGWRFTKPDNFDMSTEYYYYTGTYDFMADDVYFSLTAVKNIKHMNLDQLYLTLQDGAASFLSSPGVLFAKIKDTRNGLPHAAMKIRHTESISEYHAFLTDKYWYVIEAEFPFKTFSAEKENLTFNNILDSFETGYIGGDTDTIDLSKRSKESAEHKAEYKDGNLSWEISTVDDWIVNEYYGFGNQVYITRESTVEPEEDENNNTMSGMGIYLYGESNYIEDAEICVATYSNPENQNILDWVNQELTELKSQYNPKFMEISPVTDTMVGERNAKTYTIQVQESKYKRITTAYYISDGYYRYKLMLNYDQRDGEQEGFLDNAYHVINSFKPGEINTAEIGDLLEQDSSYVTNQVKQEIDGEFIKLTMPFLWNSQVSTNRIMISSKRYGYTSSLGFPLSSMPLVIERDYLDTYDDDGNLTYKTVEEYAKQSYVEILQQGKRNIRIDSVIEDTDFQGRDAYHFALALVAEDVPETKIDCFIVKADDNTVVNIIKMMPETIQDSQQEQIFDDIIESVRFK